MTSLSILIGLAVFAAICWFAWQAGTLEKSEDTDASDDARISTIRDSLESSDDTGAYLRKIQKESRRVRAGASK